METADTALRNTVIRRARFWLRIALICSISLILSHGVLVIFDNPDVTCDRFWCRDVTFGGLGQLFELTFLFTALEGATPWRR